MTDPRLLDLCEAYLENSLSEAEHAELQAALLRTPSSRRLFWEYMQQHAMIGELLAEAQGRRLALEDEPAVRVSSRRPWQQRLTAPLKGAIGLAGKTRVRRAALAATVLLCAGLLIYRFLPSEPAAAADLLVQVEEVQGDVYLTTATGEVPAEKGRIVRPGEKLKTGGAGSLIVLRYPDNSRLELNTDTVVRLLVADRSGGAGKQVFLEQGELLAEVVPQPAGRPLLLSTPEAEARVVGTRFRSLSLAGSTRIELEQGQLQVTRKHDRQSVGVSSGSFVIAGADNKALESVPMPVQITKARALLVSRGEPLIAAAYAADGRLVTATANGWFESYEFGKRPVSVRFQDASTRHVRAVAISADGQLLAAGGTDGRVKVRDVAIDQTRTVLDDYAIDIDPKAIGPDGKLLFNAGHMQFRSTPGGLAFAPDGQSLAVVERAKTGYAIKLYDSGTWKPRFALKPQAQPIVALAFAPQGNALASVTRDGVTLWDLAARQERHRLAGSENVRALAFSPDGRWLAGGGDDGKLRLWNAQNGRPAPSFPGLFRRCYSVAFSPDGRMLATAHEGHAALWDVAGRREIATFKGHSLAIFALAFSPDGRTLATAGWERYVRLWDITDDIRNKLSGAGAAASAATLPSQPSARPPATHATTG